MSRRKRKFHYWQDAPMPRDQLVLIPTALQEMIPPDHPVRLVDEILDQLDWTHWEAAYNGTKGQPPIHPSVLAKVLLFALIRRIRSSRIIEYELKHSIDFIWLTSGRQIDHSTISEFRRKHSVELRGIFKQMIRLAIDLGIANLSQLCIDGTRVLADANKYKTWTAERLAKALEALDSQIAEALTSLEHSDQIDQDLLGEDVSADKLPPEVAELSDRRKRLAEHMEAAKAMDESRRRNGTKGPAQLPKTDPDSRILPSKEGGYAANYTPMATVEEGAGLVVSADVVIGNVEHDQLPVIVDQVAEDFGVRAERVTADSAYTTGRNLEAAEERNVEMIGPLAEPKSASNPALREDPTKPVAADQIADLPRNPQTKRFDKTAFLYDAGLDCYYCPAGKRLPKRTTEKKTHIDGTALRVAIYTCVDCRGCPLGSECRRDPSAVRGREVRRDQYEPARERHRERMKTPQAQAACYRRQHLGEVPFAVIKACFDLRRFSLRGHRGVRQEWLWAASGFNLLRLMRRWPMLREQHLAAKATG